MIISNHNRHKFYEGLTFKTDASVVAAASPYICTVFGRRLAEAQFWCKSYYDCTTGYSPPHKIIFLLRRQHHNHLAAFHLRKLLYLTIRIQVHFQTFQHAHTQFLGGPFHDHGKRSVILVLSPSSRNLIRLRNNVVIAIVCTGDGTSPLSPR